MDKRCETCNWFYEERDVNYAECRWLEYDFFIKLTPLERARIERRLLKIIEQGLRDCPRWFPAEEGGADSG